jgi:hypothetical protein
MKKKTLRMEHPDLDIHLVDILALLDPSKTNKYTPFLIKQFKIFHERFEKATTSSLSTPKTLIDKQYKEANLLESHLLDFVLEMIGKENIHALETFDNHLKDKRTTISDITQLESFGDVHEQVVLAELKRNNSQIKKEIVTLYRDDTWLIIKPLTYESSKVYGATTKWCTSQRENSRPFYEYSKEGVLIYIVNRITNKKVAVNWYRSEEGHTELSWWDEKDRRLDSLQTNLPDFIINKVKELLISEKLPNHEFFSKKEKSKSTEVLESPIVSRYGNLIPSPDEWTVYRENTDDWNAEYEWTISDEAGIRHLNIDEAVNKTLEYNYTYSALRKSLDNLDD